MPLVLTTNDIVRNPDHQWNDVTGVQYHYPNQYKNKIKTGERFVYYRGVHRQDGTRGNAEYFGRGRIGAIRLDPATTGSSRPSWFCAIEDYVPFTPPVPAKLNDVFYEIIPQNMWRNGVRDLDPTVFEKIVAAAGGAMPAPVELSSGGLRPSAVEVESLIMPRTKALSTAPGRGVWTKSKRAKEVGDWAERVALDFIERTIHPNVITHRAAIGETPGWDIDYVDQLGLTQCVEVKGTVGGAFLSVDVTAGEMRAARLHGEAYWLYLVSDCLTDHPRVQRIRNPAARIEAGDWTARTAVYTVRFS